MGNGLKALFYMKNIDQNIVKIALKQCNSYRQDIVDRVIFEIFKLMGGIEQFVKKGTTVLLKPNLLAPGHPDKARTTHPAVVIAIAKLVQEAGGIVSVGDSPAIKAGRLVARSNGLLDACKRYDIPVKEFKKSVERKNLNGRIVKSFPVAEEVANADLVINIPKIKTHGLTTFTCAVKNNFGCLVGLKKGQYHVKFDNPYDFSQMLLDLYRCVQPGLTIVDGIVSMEGRGGPSTGTPVKTNMLLAGIDCVALDIFICHLLGIDIEKVKTNKIALHEDYGVTDINSMEIVGDDVMFEGRFRYFSSERNSAWGLPKWAVKWLNDGLVPRPYSNNQCIGCGDCVEICPAKAISIIDKRQYIETKKCIRCYCCHEICRYGAIDLIKPFGRRFFRT